MRLGWSRRLLSAARSRWLQAGPWSRRLLVAATLVTVVGTAIGCLFGPVARKVVLAEAAKRRVALRIGSVRPGWWGIRLFDLSMHPEGVEGVEVAVDRAS